MKTSTLLSTAAAAAALIISVAQAENKMDNMEKCVPMKDGKNIVKEHKNDCKSANVSCAGMSKAGDKEAWIMVPKGECEKINKGDMSGISEEIKDKLMME